MNNNELNNVPTPNVDTTPTEPTNTNTVTVTNQVADVASSTPNNDVTPVTPNNVAPATTVTPIPTVTNQAPEVKPPKSGKKTLLYIIIGLIVIGIIATGVYFFFLNDDNATDDNKSENNSTSENKEENKDGENEGEENEDETIFTPDTNPASAWNGVYTSGDNIITIYGFNDGELTALQVSITSGFSNSSFTVEDFDADKIDYNDTFLDDVTTMTITKNADGTYAVTASCSDPESMLNSINGTYTKKTFKSLGWTGDYKSDEVLVSIIELDEDYVICRITKGYSTLETSFNEVSADELYVDSFGDTLKITKTETGIKVEGTSDDPESLYGQVSGEYTK